MHTCSKIKQSPSMCEWNCLGSTFILSYLYLGLVNNTIIDQHLNTVLYMYSLCVRECTEEPLLEVEQTCFVNLKLNQSLSRWLSQLRYMSLKTSQYFRPDPIEAHLPVSQGTTCTGRIGEGDNFCQAN